MIDFRGVEGNCDLYFLRHGESQGNVRKVAQGRADYPLSEAGEEQAVVAARWFQARRLEAILTSPLARASKTADIVGQTVGLEAQILEELTELDIGDFSDMSFPEMERSDPEAWRLFQQKSWEGVPSAERISSLAARSLATWNRLFAMVRAGQRTILSVTHSGILNWIVRVSFGYRDWMPLFPMANCGIYHFHISNGMVPAGGGNTATPRYYAAWRLLNYVAEATP